MNLLSTTFAALLSTVGFASAECSTEWSIEPFIELESEQDYGETVTSGLNFVFTFGGSSKAECESEMADIRNQEIENTYAKLELCLLAEEAGSPRLIAECQAEGLLK